MKRLGELEAYLSGELEDPAADALEEALFDAPDDPDLAFFDRIARHGAKLVAHGTFDIGVTRAHIDSLVAAGHKVQLVDAGTPTQERRSIYLSGDAELIVTCLQLGRTDIERVDVEIVIVDHQVTKTIKEVAVDRSDGVIYGLCERPLAQLALGAGPTIARVRHCTGERAVIAEWHLHGHAL